MKLYSVPLMTALRGVDSTVISTVAVVAREISDCIAAVRVSVYV
jgi:hypothetical protein